MRFWNQLEIGDHAAPMMRWEQVPTPGLRSPFRIAYISDLHLRGGRSERHIDELLRSLESIAPHVILFGGDLVDVPDGLVRLEKMLARLATTLRVAGVSGNHDRRLGREAVQRIFERCGGIWLDHQTMTLTHDESRIEFAGQPTSSDDSTAVRILCAHYPKTMDQATAERYHLVFAGHLHGCQFHLLRRRGYSYPGAWFYRWNVDRCQVRTTTLIVSRGMYDRVPIRFACPREWILCELHGSEVTPQVDDPRPLQ